MGSMGFLGLNGFQVPIRTATLSDAQQMDISKTTKQKKQKDQLA
jgi:hypothetical protein